jgi:hypothetical protein
MTDLVFSGGQERDTNLVFGADGGSTIPLTTAEVIGLLPGPTLIASARYLTNTQRPTVRSTVAAWQVAQASRDGVSTGHVDAASAPTGWVGPWQAAGAMPAGVEMRQPDSAKPLRVDQSGAFQAGTREHRDAQMAHDDATRMHRQQSGGFQDAQRAQVPTDFRHQDGDRTKRPNQDARWQLARFMSRVLTWDHQSATARPRGWASGYQEAMRPPPGITLRPGVDIPAEPPRYFSPAHLLFQHPFGHRGTHLLFGEPNWGEGGPGDGEPPPGALIVVPVREVYMQVNTTSLRRIDGNVQLPTFNMRLSIDADSWVWSFSASLPADALPLVSPTGDGQPREVEALINGTPYRWLVESVRRERQFGGSTINISGRGRAALLDAPYSPTLNFANTDSRTIAQLFDDVLTDNGVPLGWTVSFDPEDWVVPEGVWSHKGSYMSAVTRLAQAAGAYVQPHASTQTLFIKARYPLAPWAWDAAAPDIELPTAPVVRESIEWVEKPRYNRVYVTGVQTGVLGRVTRAGTAGDLLAPMITEPLITEAAAARQRGLPVLSDVGRIANTTLRLPVLDQTGVITPGKLVRYVDGTTSRLGLVRGVSVDVADPELWQTINLETHVAA